MADLIDQLIAHPGLYLGTQVDPTQDVASGSVARINVTPLPGGAGSGDGLRGPVSCKTASCMPNTPSLLARPAESSWSPPTVTLP